MLKKIVILGTGGTIAGVASSPLQNISYQAAHLDVADLIGKLSIPAVLSSNLTLDSEQIFQIDSKDMGFQHWIVLAEKLIHHLQKDDVSAVVITHGTDTLEESAFFLSRILPASLTSKKPVVFTCAMRPATSLLADGPQNIQDAITVAASVGAKGVLVVSASSLHVAEWVQKSHNYRLNAFDSGDAGPLGFVEEGTLRLNYQWPEPDATTPIYDLNVLRTLPWPRVEIIMNYVGSEGSLVNMICSDTTHPTRVQGLIVAGTGNGTLSQSLEEALIELQSKGIRVLRCSRCAYGRVITDLTVTNSIQASRYSSPVKARIDLLLSLMFKL
jgi:L-asparaginase